MHLSKIGWGGLLAAVLVLVSAGLWLGHRREDDASPWPRVNDLGPVESLSRPALVITDQGAAMIWQPGASLVYQPLSAGALRIGILPYPDVIPSAWQAAPASRDAYHLVWEEYDGRLRCATVELSGKTVRGPLDLTSDSENDFSLLPAADGRAWAVWINDDRHQLAVAELDREGRAGTARYPVPFQIDRGAGALDAQNQLHLAWLASATPRTQTVYYRVDGTGESIPLHTFTLSASESLVSFALGLDAAYGYILWSTTTVERPDVERIFVLSFPLGQPANPQIIELRLPPDYRPSGRVSAPDMHLGPVDTRTDRVTAAARLRWPHPAAGQHSVLPVALTLRTSAGWRPAVVYLHQGSIQGFQVIARQPADAIPPALAVDAAGALHVVWGGLSGSTPHLYYASPGAG